MDRKRLIAGAAAVTVLALGGSGIAYATGDDSGEQRIPASDAEKAKNAALDETNGGRVTDTEVDDEEGYYEVEVTRDNGTQTDVHLDRSFKVIGASADDHGPGSDGPNDDGPGDDGGSDDGGSDD